MAQYIDKDALVAEIEKQLDKLWNLLPNTSDVVKDTFTKEEANILGKYIALESFRDYINTLEVKEVDLDTEHAIDMAYLQNWYQDSIDTTKEPIWTDEHLKELFKDFYLIPKK